MAKSEAKSRRMALKGRIGKQLLLKSHELSIQIGREFDVENDVTLYQGDCLNLLSQMPNAIADLVITSPPYNVGKEYEEKADIDRYVTQQSRVIKECIRVLSSRGSICWQVGNHALSDTTQWPIPKSNNSC